MLIKEALARGAQYIELRQTCLGDYEHGEGDAWRPDIPKLGKLAESFPGIGMNLAIAYECLARDVNPKDERFQASLQAAKVLSKGAPHLRVVDPLTFSSAWESAAQIPEMTASSLAKLAREAAQNGITLSIENVGQPIRSMTFLVQAARKRLTTKDGAHLGICPDPANQVGRYPASDPIGEIEATPMDMLKIVHFKQSRGGKTYPTIDTGDVDCPRQLKMLVRRGYKGAAVLEIPPHEDAFNNLSASLAYLRAASSLK
jgi:sugar phosphate isomerase/epimerase